MMQATLDAIPEEPIAFIDLQAQRRRLGARIDDAIRRVLDHGKFIMGPEVADLEDRLATHCGARHAIGCSSGTDALVLGLMALGVGSGDAVFVPSFTFAATAEAVALLGATPVFCDILEDTFNLDPDSLEQAIDHVKSQALTPRAVIAVDLFGQPADYRRILPLVESHGLKMITDAAQSFGATFDGRRVGTFGDITATSFFPAKPLGCYGDGGAILTESDELASIIRSLRVHGQGSNKYDNQRIGINGRLDTLQAAILLAKLEIFEDEIVNRQRVAETYNVGLATAVEVPRLAPGATSVWAQYTVRSASRDALASHMKDRGIPTAIYYPMPLNRQAAYRDFPTVPAGTPVSDRAAGRVLSLPMHPYLTGPTQERIIEAVCAAARSDSVLV